MMTTEKKKCLLAENEKKFNLNQQHFRDLFYSGEITRDQLQSFTRNNINYFEKFRNSIIWGEE